MAFTKNLGKYSGNEIPKAGVKMTNSDRMHSSKHKNLMKKKKKK